YFLLPFKMERQLLTSSAEHTPESNKQNRSPGSSADHNSSRCSSDNSMASWHRGGMGRFDELPDRDPYEGWAAEMRDRYPVTSEFGRSLRRADAKKRLQEMTAVEEEIRNREAQHAEIADRIARFIADHELQMQYLIHFGVRAEEREMFRHILEDVANHGGLTLRQAADLCFARQNRDDPANSSGTTESSPEEDPFRNGAA
ncbi:MAG: hypothetical protein KDA84_07760, partial [Planctomycetaceae bacterium]|nr:hypothetical protein [Planctomycetaceae bacterium]